MVQLTKNIKAGIVAITLGSVLPSVQAINPEGAAQQVVKTLDQRVSEFKQNDLEALAGMAQAGTLPTVCPYERVRLQTLLFEAIGTIDALLVAAKQNKKYEQVLDGFLNMFTGVARNVQMKSLKQQHVHALREQAAQAVANLGEMTVRGTDANLERADALYRTMARTLHPQAFDTGGLFAWIGSKWKGFNKAKRALAVTIPVVVAGAAVGTGLYFGLRETDAEKATENAAAIKVTNLFRNQMGRRRLARVKATDANALVGVDARQVGLDSQARREAAAKRMGLVMRHSIGRRRLARVQATDANALVGVDARQVGLDSQARREAAAKRMGLVMRHSIGRRRLARVQATDANALVGVDARQVGFDSQARRDAAALAEQQAAAAALAAQQDVAPAAPVAGSPADKGAPSPVRHKRGGGSSFIALPLIVNKNSLMDRAKVLGRAIQVVDAGSDLNANGVASALAKIKATDRSRLALGQALIALIGEKEGKHDNEVRAICVEVGVRLPA